MGKIWLIYGNSNDNEILNLLVITIYVNDKLLLMTSKYKQIWIRSIKNT